MPDTLIILSDMKFNRCGTKTNHGAMKQKYKEAGYEVPKIVYWNVNGRKENNPVKYDAEGVCMISGFSPAILSTVLTGKDFDPMSAMNDAVLKSRYDVAELASSL